MALFEIPTNKDLDNYEFSMVINQVLYFFDIQYNVRIDRYILNIKNSLKQHLLSGIPVLTNVDLTENLRYLEIPQGIILPFSFDNANAGFQDLGDKVRIYYNE